MTAAVRPSSAGHSNCPAMRRADYTHEDGIRAWCGWHWHDRVPGLMHSSCPWPWNHRGFGGEFDGVDVDALTTIETESRKECKKMVDFFRSNVPGCKDMVQVETSSQLGVRQTRRATGDHVLAIEEVKDRTRFEDCIAR